MEGELTEKNMNYRYLGDTGIKVSEIGFGAWGIGGTPMDARAYGPTDDNESHVALRKAFETGITFYDTAALYGYGHSEEVIGATLKDVRKHIIISSKVGYKNFKGEQDFSAQYIRHSLEGSLRRLQTDYIDVYQLHDPPIELLQKDDSIIENLNLLIQEGKIRVAGISTRSPEDSLIAIKQFDFKSIQVNFNLSDQRALELGLFEECKDCGAGIIIRTPLCFGFLTGKYSANDNYAAGDHRAKWSPEQIERWAEAYKLFVSNLPEKEEQTNAQIALRFCLSYSSVSTVIPGMLTHEHVEENVLSSQLGPFSPSILEQFNTIYRKHNFFI